jgi:hypothetical protein
MRVVRVVAPMFLALGLALAVAGTAKGVTPSIKVTLTANPNPAPRGVDVTLTGKVSPVGGTFDRVTAQMDVYHPTSCTPSVGTCTIFTAYITWTIGALTAPATISVTGPVAGEHFVFFSITNCNNECLTDSAMVTVGIPKASATITCSPAGAVMPGTTVHVSLGASVNAGPVQADLQANLPTTGLSDPTGLPAGAIWNPAPYYYIDNEVTLDRSASYSFDVKVTAPVGTDLVVSVIVRTMTGVSNDNLKKSVVIHVGPTATRTSLTGPTVGPAPSQNIGTSPSASPIPEPTPGSTVAPSSDPLATSSLSAIAGAVAATTAPPSGPIASSSDADSSPIGDSVPLWLAGGMTTIAACGGLILLLLRRGRLSRL